MQKLRRPVFWTWIAITIVVAGYIGLAAPFAAYVGADKAWVAVIVPPAMILLLGIGVAWLFLFVATPVREPRDRSPEDRHPLARR